MFWAKRFESVSWEVLLAAGGTKFSGKTFTIFGMEALERAKKLFFYKDSMGLIQKVRLVTNMLPHVII